MAERRSRLGEHHEAFIDACVDSGRFRDYRDVVESALRLLEEREASYAACCTEVARGFDPDWKTGRASDC